VWQELRTELHPQGLEIVTVALDTDTTYTKRWIERAQPQHPSLIDQAHVVDELFGILNVPSGVWIDESGMIVRPPEPAAPQRAPDRPPRTDLTARQAESLEQTRKIRNESEKYLAALRDWVAKGRESRYALAPDEVIERSRPRGVAEATAAAHFELAQHLYRQGRADDAVRHFREAHRLDPQNWTYKRQAWSIADPAQGPTDVYDSDWLTDVKKIGGENYYPPLQMD
jgi:tetratricopeptide (TPR) repeat protein